MLNIRTQTISALAALSSCIASAQTVTYSGLLEEMADRDALARFPSPAYRQLQGSTYNRASVARDQPDQTFSGWFADSDGVFSVRQEPSPSGGATEHVVMEHNGPGAITKLWTPFFYRDYGNRTGARIRIYLNGSNVPVIDEHLIELVTRLEWSTSEYGSKPASRNSFTVPHPIAGFTARAGNCYLPIPFSGSCKVTMSDLPFYDIVSYRAYDPGTAVEDFSMALYAAASNQARLNLTAQQIGSATNFDGGTLHQTNRSLSAGAAMTLHLNAGAAAVRHLEVRLDAAQIAAAPAALRSTVLIMTFDGGQTVWCPLGDYFCSADSIHPFDTWTRSVTADGRMICRWVKPYRTSASLTLANFGANAVDATLSARTGDWTWNDNSMHFHASWRPDDVVPGTPPSDWNFMDALGKGVLVGVAWTVGNIHGSWWGEGDEKIYVDDDYDVAKFPGLFGTGTEDYYGWAGGVVPTRTDEFSAPYLANVRVGGLDGGTKGYNINTRIRALDAIPFTRRLRFDMESSFGTDMRNPWNVLGYSSTVFWYAMPGATDNRPPDPAEASKPLLSMAQLQAISDRIRYGTNSQPGTSPGSRWNLGEDDAGAGAGGTGAATSKDALGGNDLTRFGAPAYSASVPAGGSTLSMRFSGTNSCYYVMGTNLAAYYAGVDFDTFSMSCDANPGGNGADGFSVAMSAGALGAGSVFVYHTGGTWRVHVNGVGDIIRGPAVTWNVWTHLELVRADFGSGPEYRLFINGADVGSSGLSAVRPGPAFTVGGNYRNVPLTDPRPFEGCFKGLIDNVVMTDRSAQPTVSAPSLRLFTVGDHVIVSVTGTPSCLHTLSRTPQLSPAAWSPVASRVMDFDGQLDLPDASPPSGGAFYRAHVR